jgi:hypothetical protein
MAQRFTWALALTPWVCLALIGTMVVHALVVFGINPEISPDTPFPVSLHIHSRFFQVAFAASILAAPAWIFAVCRKKFQRPLREHFTQILVYVFGCAVVNFSPIFEPTGVASRLVSW